VRLVRHRAREGLSSSLVNRVHIPRPLRREVLRRCTFKVFAPSLAFAQFDGARLLLAPVARLTVTTRQALRNAADCGLAYLLMRFRRGASPVGFPLAAAARLPRWLDPSSDGTFPRWLVRAAHGRFGATASPPYSPEVSMLLDALTVAVNGSEFTWREATKVIRLVSCLYSKSGGGRGIRTPEGLRPSGFQARIFSPPAFAKIRQRSPRIQPTASSSANVRRRSP